MIDVVSIRSRIRKPPPTVTVDAKSVSADYHNHCILEWCADRRDLAAALDEIAALRQLMPKEIVDLLRTRSEAMAKVAVVDAALESLVKHAPGEGVLPSRGSGT